MSLIKVTKVFRILHGLISIGNIEEITELHLFIQELKEKGESIPVSEHQSLQTLHVYLQDTVQNKHKREEETRGGESKKKAKLTTKAADKEEGARGRKSKKKTRRKGN